MKKRPSKLDRLQIPEPCSVGWERMTGDENRRFCSACNKHVYNLSTMTRRQAEAILATSRGNLCARVTRKADGTVLTTDDFFSTPPKLHQINRRASPIASAVISAIMAISPIATAQTRIPTESIASGQQQDGQKKPQGQSEGSTAKLSGTVLDSNGAVVARAQVSLRKEGALEVLRVTSSSEEGVFLFEALQPDIYTLAIEAPGFMTAEVSSVNLQQVAQCQIEVPLTVSTSTEMGGAIAVISVQPLRALYEDSDLIVVATVDKSKKVEDEDERSLMRTTLSVSSTLKGQRKSSVPVYHWVYKDEVREFVAGNKLLLFLQEREVDGKQQGYEVEDANYGIKKLSDESLNLYTQRLEELAKIEQEKKLDRRELLEWLVRCAEERATRFEGAYELVQGAEALRTQQAVQDVQQLIDAHRTAVAQVESERAKTAENKFAAPVPEIVSPTDTNNISTPDAVEKVDLAKLAALLTTEQKDRLLNALYATAELDDRDERLIRLAVIWEDERLLPFLVLQLRSVQESPPFAANTALQVVVELLDDEDVQNARDEYEEVTRGQLEALEEERNPDRFRARIDGVEARQRRSEKLKAFLEIVEAKIKEAEQKTTDVEK
jgi:hypothetical protein